MVFVRAIKRVEATKKDTNTRRVTSGISKPNKPCQRKTRAEKLRALADTFVAPIVPTDVATLPVRSPRPREPLEVAYELGEKIGEGKQGVVVYRCAMRSSGLNYAVKRVPKISNSAMEPAMPSTLRHHAQLVTSLEVFEGTHTIDYVMELQSGGDLFEWIASHGALDEEQAQAIFMGILTGLKQVHTENYIHRDLKLENVLLTTPEPWGPEHVRLADFEFCTTSPALGPVGSIGYAAPETLASLPYTEKIDNWAAGVCLYAMLSASAPFECFEDETATAERILSAQPESLFEEPCWVEVSHAAKDLVRGLLHPDPEHRMPLDMARAHPWLAGAIREQSGSWGVLAPTGGA